jgi:Dockerin type I domain
VNLTGVTNAQTVTVTLNNATDSSAQTLPDTLLNASFLLGDTSGNGTVSASDISQTKAQSGQSVIAANFREDLNANGAISATDIALVKSQSRTALP